MSLMYRVRVATTGWGGAPGLNTFYFVDSADDTVADTAGAQECVDRVHAAFNDLRMIYPGSTTFTINPAVDVLTAASGELSVSFGTDPGAPFVGGGEGGYGPAAAMVCLTFTTDSVINGHRVRGRSFFGPLIGDSDANGTPVAFEITRAEGFGASLGYTTGEPVAQVIWHRPTGGAGGVAARVTGHAVKDQFAVLRSRRD